MQAAGQLRLLFRLAFLCLLLQLGLFYRFFIDDAFISFRYARNWVLGTGLVFNPGELVEGCSNLLWVLLLAGANWLGLDIVVASKLLGLAAIAAVLIIASRLVRQMSDDALCAGGVVLLLASSFGVVFFGITGLETTLFSAWLLMGAYAVVANGTTVGTTATLCLFAAALTRPEGVLYFVAAVLVVVWRARGITRQTLWSGALFTVLGALLLAWRHGYYGAWVPNTFFAKPPTHDLDRLPIITAFNEVYSFVMGTGGVLFLVLAIAALVRQRSGATVLVAAFCLVGLGFQLYSGGDWMERCRFLAPVLPFYVILGVLGLQQCLRALLSTDQAPVPGGRKNYALVVVLLVLAVTNLIDSARFYLAKDAYPNFVMTSEDLIPAGQWVGEHYPHHYSIVCWRTGALAYFSGLSVIDATYGLTDHYVARQRFAGTWNPNVREQYLHGRNPELLMNGGSVGTTPDPRVVVGGREYDFVRRFRQGADQEWYLYQRADLSPAPG